MFIQYLLFAKYCTKHFRIILFNQQSQQAKIPVFQIIRIKGFENPNSW